MSDRFDKMAERAIDDAKVDVITGAMSAGDALQKRVASAIRTAVAEEREVCASLAATVSTPNGMARAIRARGR